MVSFPCLLWLNILVVWQGEPEELDLEEAELFEDESPVKKQKMKKAARKRKSSDRGDDDEEEEEEEPEEELEPEEVAGLQVSAESLRVRSRSQWVTSRATRQCIPGIAPQNARWLSATQHGVLLVMWW